MHLSVDGYPVEVGKRFWTNDLRVVTITEVASHSNSYADTSETQTWHKHTEGSSDTLSGRLQPYGRLIRVLSGKDAEEIDE